MMQLDFIHPSPAQRLVLQQRFARLQDPSVALTLLRQYLPLRTLPVQAVCTPQSIAPDRFVLRVETRTAAGTHAAYAFKSYADDRGRRIMAVSQALAAWWHQRQEPCVVCVPAAYVPDEDLLISRWVAGRPADTGLERDHTAPLAGMAATLAHLHRAQVVPEAVTSAPTIVEAAVTRCERLSRRQPAVADMLAPLVDALQAALPCLAPALSTVVHGDVAPHHFLWDGHEMVLIDLDLYGYTDPAYDAGHFLAQVHRWCLSQPTLTARTPQVLATFRAAYHAMMPTVAVRNISFYYGLTLIRKIYTVCRQQPPRWPQLVAALIHAARAALENVGLQESDAGT
jgi:Phosphotransferase enzyme family